MSETDEKVLCVGREAVDYILSGPGDQDWNLKALLNQKTYRYRNTPNDGEPPVEQDDRWKQVIPYIVVVNKDGQILAFNRGKDGGEKKLAGKWAVGFGGHINDQDADWMAGIKREIREEIDVNHPIAFDKRYFDKVHWAKLYGPIGFIDDNSDPVGQHHTGVVYVLRANEVVPKEVGEFSWETFESLSVGAEAGLIHLESWAVLALPMVRAWIDGRGA